jgi:hypothetical protein
MTKNNKVIVTTTINSPTKATLEFCKRKNFDFVIVGDLKTPHDEYNKLEKEFHNVKYLNPNDQNKLYSELSDAIGWNCIQRRSIGFVHAYLNNYDIVASVDDDNIPYQEWGQNILVGKEVEIDLYDTENLVFDPLSVTNTPLLWHRGYPIELVPHRNKISYIGRVKRNVMVQADLWDGDPDIDAIARLSMRPCVKYDNFEPFGSTKLSPFNSQNTFLHRDVLKYYMMLPFVGRMDDIWPSYIVQKFFPNSLIYCKPSVYQDRNPQDLITNLEKEIFGYRNTLKFINNIEAIPSLAPEETKKAIKIYISYFKK